jgi:hypothetical protein
VIIEAIGRAGKLALLLTLSVLALTLAAQQISLLVVNGLQGQAKVIQVEGRNYVEVDGLARLTNGSISFNGNQIVLTLPGSGGNAPAQAAVQAPSSPPGFSKVCHRRNRSDGPGSRMAHCLENSNRTWRAHQRCVARCLPRPGPGVSASCLTRHHDGFG